MCSKHNPFTQIGVGWIKNVRIQFLKLYEIAGFTVEMQLIYSPSLWYHYGV